MPRKMHQTDLTHKSFPADPFTERLPHSIDHRKILTYHFLDTFSLLPTLFFLFVWLVKKQKHISLCLVKLADPSNIGKTNDGPGKQSSILLHYLRIIWSIMAFEYQFYQEWKVKKKKETKYSTNSGLQLCCKTSRLRMAWCTFLVLQLKGLISNAHYTAFSVCHSQYALHWKIC